MDAKQQVKSERRAVMNGQFRNRAAALLTTMTLLPGADLQAQAPPNPPTGQLFPTSQSPGADRLTPSELEELLGAIALYPDPLLANVLAASVYPAEVAEAANFISGGGKPEAVDAKPWEAPVKAVAKIPDAIKMMGQYSDWTVALGQAYLVQAKDVMDTVQTLRKKAQENGALKTSPQQKVVVEEEVIYISPADPEIIYVPSYSPSVVYVEHYDDDAVAAGIIGFGVGIAAGLIIANNLDCDFHGGHVGYGWGGHNDININGDVNINRNTNINRNDVRNTASIGNRVGNEGNAWAPNKSKNIATQQPSKLNQFKGGPTAANRPSVPGGRTPAAGVGGRPAGQLANRPAGQPGNRPSAQPLFDSGGVGSPRSSSNASPRVPQTPPREASQSAFSGGRGTEAASQRGASSRSQSAGSSGRSAPSRSAGGGGGRRGGGGRAGGGRGR